MIHKFEHKESERFEIYYITEDKKGTKAYLCNEGLPVMESGYGAELNTLAFDIMKFKLNARLDGETMERLIDMNKRGDHTGVVIIEF